MEKVASNVMFPCKYSTSGCTVSLVHTEKADHEDACEFRPYSCPCPGASCKWQGSLEQVMPHLVMSHKSITTLQGIKFCIFNAIISYFVLLLLLFFFLVSLLGCYDDWTGHCQVQLSMYILFPYSFSSSLSSSTIIINTNMLFFNLGEDIVFLATDVNLPGAVDWVMMQSCFNQHFMLVLEKQEKYDGHQQFFAIVQLIGSRKQAENFAYR